MMSVVLFYLEFLPLPLMSADQENASSPPTSVSARWRKVWSSFCDTSSQTYCHLSTATRCVLVLTCKLLAVAYFIFCALFLTVRYGILPEIDGYKSNIEHIASHALGRPVSVEKISASWRGLRPQLQLSGVVIHDQYGAAALALPQVSATLSWTTILAGAPRFDNLTIVNPDLSILRDANGKLFIAGLPVSSTNDNSAGADWLLSQREIVIRDGKLRWLDQMRGAPELTLTNVNLMLHNHWRQHQISLRATPPADHAGPIDVRANFYHPAFASKISDISRWTGTVYADLHDADLAVWKNYLDYPVELNQGVGAVRAWLDLDHAKVANFTADVQLSNLSMRLNKSLEPLQLARISGRISAKELFAADLQDGIPTFGAKGHQLTLTNFSLQTNDGFALPPTSISETYEPATVLHQEKIQLNAKLLDLTLLSQLGERLPLTASQHQLLSDLAPSGQLQDVAVQWQGSYPDVHAYSIRGAFKGLGMQAQAARNGVPAIPGFANLSGQIDATEKGGQLSLASQNGTFLLPSVFTEPELAFAQLNVHSHWEFQKNQHLLFQIDDMDFALDGIAGSLSGSHLIALQGKAPGIIDLKAHFSTYDLRKLPRYLPSRTPKQVSDWLAGGLVSGKLTDVDVIAKGDLADFPLHPLKPGAKSNTEFKLSGKFDGLAVNYTPGHTGKDGKSPLWPLLEDASGTVSIDRSRLEILADSGKTNGVPVADVKAVFADLISPDTVLEIDGAASGPLQEMLRYVDDSPVTQWIGHFTEATRSDGNAKLALKFQLPLHHMLDTKVNGTLRFLNNNVNLLPGLPVISHTNGTLTFNEKGFGLETIKGVFLNEPVVVAGGTLRDGSDLVKIDGVVSAEGLRRSFPEPAQQRLLSKLSGTTRYTATVAIHQNRPEIMIDSNLQGLALDLPSPLQKAAADNWPLKFEINDLISSDPLQQHDEIKMSLASIMSAHYLRHKALGPQNNWEVTSGGIGFGQAAPQPDSGLAVAVVTQTLDVDKWLALRAAMNKQEDGSEAAPDPALSAYSEPDVIAGRANELVVMGKKLDNVVLGASRQDKLWQVNIASNQVSGYVSWRESGSGSGLGRVTARLASLNIPKSASADVGEMREDDSAFKIPALDIVAEDFQLFGKRLGRLELNADNVRTNGGREWHINKLNLANPDAELHASGSWTVQGKNNSSDMTYALDLHDAGKLLERFGFVGVLKGGKGKLDGDISWKGLPFALDIPSLSGTLHIDVQEGQFLKVEPGAAKLLGVLNLQTLPRRLALDFRDVFSQGFAFDNIVGTATVAQGTATTDNLKMTGVAASVLMNGAADIAKETQNLHLVVIPDFNVGTASIVALAINPVIGVGSFLAQLFLHEPLMKSLTYEYNVTGSWSDPVVVKQEHKSTPAAAAPAAK